MDMSIENAEFSIIKTKKVCRLRYIYLYIVNETNDEDCGIDFGFSSTFTKKSYFRF